MCPITATAHWRFWPQPVLGTRLHAPGLGTAVGCYRARAEALRLKGSVGGWRGALARCVLGCHKHWSSCLAAATLDGNRRPRANPLQTSLLAVSFQLLSRKPGSPPSRHQFEGVAVPRAGESSQNKTLTSRLDLGCVGDARGPELRRTQNSDSRPLSPAPGVCSQGFLGKRPNSSGNPIQLLLSPELAAAGKPSRLPADPACRPLESTAGAREPAPSWTPNSPCFPNPSV